MRGPSLTTSELIAYLTLRVERFEQLGLSREMAVRAVAADDNLNEEKVVAIISKFSNDSDVAA